KIASMSLVALLCSLLAFAQTRTVSGVIIDGDGKPLSFASVTIKGTKTGTTADADGKFILKNVATGTTLVVSAIGFSDREVSVGTSDNLNVVLQATAGANLSEVVVTTALGIKRKPKEIGYATGTVKQDQITASKNPNLGQALSGKVSGLTVANTSAEVGATPRITLRGMRSITGDNTALIVLDGVPVPSNTINYINPNDVERVDIMKGGQAATLFGSEGVNGAIIITTKKGSAKPEIVFTHTSNIEQVAYLPKGQTSFGSGSAYGSSREG